MSRALMRSVLLLPALAAGVTIAACDRHDDTLPMLAGGDAGRGRIAAREYGCGSCHDIPGVSGAHGLIGPPLGGIAHRMYVGGVTTNTPDHLVAWIENPRQFDSKTAMPVVGVNHRDAVDIASYLYTLR